MNEVGPLTIGVDARELLGESTGVGRYLDELLRRWITRPDAAARRFVLYTPEPLPFMQEVPPGAPITEVVVGGGRGTWWEQTHLRRAIKSEPPDVFFAGAYTAPLALRLPLALSVHDVSFAAHPEWFRPREGARRRLLTRQAARGAEVVFTASEFSRREIVERLSVPTERIRVIPPGVTPRTPGDAREPLVLFVGSILNRRRLPSLIWAFAAAAKTVPGARLVIAGSDRSYPPLDLAGVAREAGVSGSVTIPSYVSEDELNRLYGHAGAFVFLSEYEGFGMTPLEALSANVPIVVLDTAIAREVYGDSAWYVSPEAPPSVVGEAIRALLTDPARAAGLLAGAPQILARYSWDLAADQTLEGIERIARP